MQILILTKYKIIHKRLIKEMDFLDNGNNIHIKNILLIITMLLKYNLNKTSIL